MAPLLTHCIAVDLVDNFDVLEVLETVLQEQLDDVDVLEAESGQAVAV